MRKVLFNVRTIASCACSLVALAALSSSAWAARGHVFSTTFAGPCAAEPCEGTLKEPAGVAVNEASGEVYVVDKGANRVVRYGASGEYISEFNGSGELAGEEHAAGSLGREGEVPTGRFEAPDEIAIDNSTAAGDPSKGDVYVVDAGPEHRVIDKYSPAGEYLGQISGAGGESFKGGPLDGVAVDRAGTVWVYSEATLDIYQFNDATPNEFVAPPISTVALLAFPVPGFAVDSGGNFYVRYAVLGGEARVAKLDHAGNVLIKEVSKQNSSAVAVDQTTDNAFVDNGTSIAVFDPAGDEVERLGEEGVEQHLNEGVGVAVNATEASESVYVADAATHEVVVFGPATPSAPTIESEAVTAITSSSAELGAEINPRSEAAEDPTEYQFQYGACPSLGQCESAPYEATVPIPPGQIPGDFEAHAVSALVQGLTASTTYHFKVIARNSLGSIEGSEATFTTQGSGGQLALPDRRGWELVSPPDKHGALIEPISESGVVQAAASGQGITYLANATTEAQPEGYTNKVQVLSRRGPAAWSSRDIAIPHTSATGLAVGAGVEYKFFDPELTLSAVQPFGEFVPQLSEAASESTAYLHELDESCGSSCFRPLVTGKPGSANVEEGVRFGEEERCQPNSTGVSVVCGPEFLDASEDMSHVVVRAGVALSAGAGSQQLYEWSGGQLEHVSVLPGGTAAVAPDLGADQSQSTRRAISADGSRIDWEAQSFLYQRDTARGETSQIDEGEGCGGCESGGGEFQSASADGTRVFFADDHRLTADSGGEPNGSNPQADLYECRMVVQGEKLHCVLSDLTPASGGEGANVQGQLLGASEDGEYLYFVADGVQSGENAQGESPAPGQPNLYERHEGMTSFVATLAGGDSHDWNPVLRAQPTRVSPNGRFLELMSEARLTGYDNRDVSTGKPTAEVYLYDASKGELSCASCDPTGARPVGVEYFKLEPGSGGLVGGPRGTWTSAGLVAANVPGWTAISSGAQTKSRYQPRYLNDEGRLFFNSVNALVSQDSNGTQDVYEYEPPGVGDCTEASATYSARSSGCVGLISSGKSTRESAFLDASESGDDVFFLTAARLSAIDVDTALDVYDAHVCADSPCIIYPEEKSSQCSEESSCRPLATPQPNIFGAQPSMIFQGPGNFAPPLPGGSKPKPKSAEEIRLEKLQRALKACRAKHNKKTRRACELSARKRYAKPGARQKHEAKKKRKGKSSRRGR